jgi:hypothetical protein
MFVSSSVLELFRRTIWGFLRLENEHRSNTSEFRRVNFVPLHFTTGHAHHYDNKGKEHSGFSVLLEVGIIAAIVLGACIISVVMAQHATEQATALMEQQSMIHVMANATSDNNTNKLHFKREL